MAYEIKYTKAAHIALGSLIPEARFQFDMLIDMIKTDITNEYLKNKLQKLSSSSAFNLFSLKINGKYRGLLQIDDQSITVADIVNHESLKQLFNHKQNV